MERISDVEAEILGVAPATPKPGIVRPPMRDEDPRAAAARRAAEIMGHIGDADQGSDDFFIPAEFIPPGWSYEWKRHTIYGQEDPAYQVQLARTGWTAVPASRHPEMMPAGSSFQTIERKGMVLMERPLEISERFREMDRRQARAQMAHKEEQLGHTPPGTLDRGADPRVKPRITRSYEPGPISVPTS